jgi:hypothetical protein
MGHLEFWRIYESCQFIYLSGVREQAESAWREKLLRRSAHSIVPPFESFDWASVPGFIDIVNLVYIVTEFVEFAARLAAKLPDADSYELSVGLHDIAGFVLTLDEPLRNFPEYHAASETTLANSWMKTPVELISSTETITIEVVEWFLVRFGWLNPDSDQIRNDITNLRRGR